jgi:integrase/recombinase XerC
MKSLRSKSLNVAADTLPIMGKSRGEREPLTLLGEIKDALAAWLQWQNFGTTDAPLFICLQKVQGDVRISCSGIYHLIRDHLGACAGVKARTHGLRHAAVTAVLGSSAAISARSAPFFRHAYLDTVRSYDDFRADHAGKVAAALSAIVQ